MLPWYLTRRVNGPTPYPEPSGTFGSSQLATTRNEGVYAGTQPAGLFRSEDWGQSWSPVEGINRHPYPKYWTGTGGGDSSLHSVQVDPRDRRRVNLAAEGLALFHGFPVAVTRHAPDAVFVVPLDWGADNFRVCPGQFTVYRSCDAARTWEPLIKGATWSSQLPKYLP